MAERNPPSWLAAGSHPAQNDRLMLADLFGTEGVLSATALKVSERSGTPNMSVDVAVGSAAIQGDDVSYQGMYHVVNDAVKNVVISTADATNPRKDLIVARVKDNTHGQAGDLWEIAAITGVPNASPIEPALPASAIKLAVVTVGAGVTSILNANIADGRTASEYWSKPRGVLAHVTNTTSQTGLTTADATNMTATVTGVVGRRLLVSWYEPNLIMNQNGDIFELKLNELPSTARQRVLVGTPTLNTQIRQSSVEYRYTVTTAGSVGWKATVVLVSGSSTLDIVRASDQPGYFTVEDVGGVLL